MPADAEVVRHGQQQAGEHAAVDAFVLGADGQERQAAGQPRQSRMRWMQNRQADCVAK
jgi:hypothetical protein